MDQQTAMSQALGDQMVQVTQMIESQVDAEINKLDKLDSEDMEVMREQRMAAMKRAQQQRRDLLQNGHGRYFEIPDERTFFEETKKSKKLVCHFYRDATFRCKIVDKHLEALAPKHVECKFIKINAEKCKFLVDRLRIVVLPTLALVREGKTVDYIVGFDDLGGRDDFPSEMMEWRIARADVINYSGDLLHPPGSEEAGASKKSILGGEKKIIRGGGKRGADMSSDEDDW